MIPDSLVTDPMKPARYLIHALFLFGRISVLTGIVVGAPEAPAEKIRRLEQVAMEKPYQADHHDGTFQNPILWGHWHDPTVVRVGEDYYLSHCEHDQRGPLIWHSRDLVNWRPVSRVESLANLPDIWATDLIFHEGLFYLYVPVRLETIDGHLTFTNVVVTAADPAGPWSEPVDLGIGGIDPGHVVDTDGSRYLYVNAGRVVQLAADGLSVTSEMTTVYEGWPIPEEWTMECHCLESPKLFWRDGWCYLVSAQGGTAGPSTSHMVVVARSRSALGPWENDPDSPLLRTTARSDPWWSQGHGTLIEDTAGAWWMMYHAIPRERRSLGRNTLLLPIAWTSEGWPRIPPGISPDNLLAKPAGENVGHGMPLSDNFDQSELGWQWDPMEATADFATAFTLVDGDLVVAAKGNDASDARRLTVLPTNESYELILHLTAPTGTAVGLGMFADRFVGIEYRESGVRHPRRGVNFIPDLYPTGEVFLRVVNRDHDVDFFHSPDGVNWSKFPWGASASTESTQRAGFYASGQGTVKLHAFTYRGLP